MRPSRLDRRRRARSKVSNYTFSSFLTDGFVCSASASIDIQYIPLTISLGVATRLILQPLLLRQRTEAQQNRRLDTKHKLRVDHHRDVQYRGKLTGRYWAQLLSYQVSDLYISIGHSDAYKGNLNYNYLYNNLLNSNSSVV